MKKYKDNIILFDTDNYLEIVKLENMKPKNPPPDPKNKKAATKILKKR